MKNLFRFLVICSVLLSIISCSSDSYSNDDPKPIPNIITFNATLTGDKEVPMNSSTATGSAVLTFNNTTKIFSVVVTHSIATPTAGHIHVGAIGVSGPPVFPFASLTSPINYSSMALDATQEADLKSDKYYVNIHSATYPGGEIRGQLIKQIIGY